MLGNTIKVQLRTNARRLIVLFHLSGKKENLCLVEFVLITYFQKTFFSRSDKFFEHVKKYHTPQQHQPAPLLLRPTPSSTSTTTLTPIVSYTLPTTSKTFRIEKRMPNPVSPFNVVNPPNKSVIDAMHGTFTDDSQVPIEEPVEDLAQGKIIVVDDPFEIMWRVFFLKTPHSQLVKLASIKSLILNKTRYVRQSQLKLSSSLCMVVFYYLKIVLRRFRSTY